MDEQFELDVYLEELFDGLEGRSRTRNYFYERFSFGFQELDRKIGAFLPGDLMLITSDKPLGKTSLILNSIANDGACSENYVFFSLDTKRFRIFEKLLTILSRFDVSQDRELPPEIMKKISEAVEELKDINKNLVVYERQNATVLDIQTTLVEYIRKSEKTPVVFVDSLELIKKTKDQQALDVVIDLKNLSKEIGVPIIATCKAVEGMEQVADVVLRLEGDENDRYRDIIVSKNRNGHLGKLKFRFIKHISLFEPIEDIEMLVDLKNMEKGLLPVGEW